MTERHDEKSPGITKRLLGPGRRRAKPVPTNLLLPPPRASGVYVDIENLRNAQHARAVVETVIRDWPDDLPPVRRLCLYAPADKTGLWGAWAPTRFPDFDVRVRGVQRFARESSKNSADIAIVADAIADFTTGVANHIAVVSNDSDFGALFVKIQELASEAGNTTQPPFLWINLPGGSGLSKEIEDFVPEGLRWVIASPPPAGRKASSKPVEGNGAALPANQIIVQWVLDEIPAGSRFRAEHVRKMLTRRCPDHDAAKTTGVCGSFLSQQLMPLLGPKGVRSSARVREPTREAVDRGCQGGFRHFPHPSGQDAANNDTPPSAASRQPVRGDQRAAPNQAARLGRVRVSTIGWPDLLARHHHAGEHRERQLGLPVYRHPMGTVARRPSRQHGRFPNPLLGVEIPRL